MNNKILNLMILGSIALLLTLSSCEPEPLNEYEAEDSGTFTDKRDSQAYNWVRIGDQIWMADNLAYSNGGVAYENDINNANIYGYLYASPMVEAPEGWHIPSEAEWLQLINYITSSDYSELEAYALKSSIGWNNQGNGDDYFGFRALPGGERWSYRGGIWNFRNMGQSGGWWTTTKIYNTNKYSIISISADSNEPEILNASQSGYYNLSIRCIKD